MVWDFYSIVAPNLTEKKSDPTGLIGSTYLLFGISQNKHVYGDTCLGAVKRRSALNSAVERSEIDVTEGDTFSFRENFGTVTKLGYNKGEKIHSFAYLPFWCETFISIYSFSF